MARGYYSLCIRCGYRPASPAVVSDTPTLPPRLRIGLISAEASLARLGGTTT